MSGYGIFLRGLLDHPRDVSAPTPSSPTLAAAIASKVDSRTSGLVVELGAGSGAVTKALLARGIEPHRLVVIEIGEYFAKLLRRRFAGITVIQGDALQFDQYLPANSTVSAVVSGLPLLNFSLARRRALIEKALSLQESNGCFVQLSYSWQPALSSGDFVLEKNVVWRNFPPAHIWTYRR